MQSLLEEDVDGYSACCSNSNAKCQLYVAIALVNRPPEDLYLFYCSVVIDGPALVSIQERGLFGKK